MKSIIAVTLFIVTCSLSAFSQSDSRAGLLKEIETKRAELAKLEAQFLLSRQPRIARRMRTFSLNPIRA